MVNMTKPAKRLVPQLIRDTISVSLQKRYEDSKVTITRYLLTIYGV